jgi:hypothetical protein
MSNTFLLEVPVSGRTQPTRASADAAAAVGHCMFERREARV